MHIFPVQRLPFLFIVAYFRNFARYTNDYENHTKPYIEPIENDIYRDIMISHWTRDHEHFASFKCVVTIRCIPPLPNTPTPPPCPNAPHTDWCVMVYGFRFRRNSLEDTIPKLCSDRNGIHTHAREEDVSTATQNSTRLRLDISIFHLVLVSYVFVCMERYKRCIGIRVWYWYGAVVVVWDAWYIWKFTKTAASHSHKPMNLRCYVRYRMFYGQEDGWNWRNRGPWGDTNPTIYLIREIIYAYNALLKHLWLELIIIEFGRVIGIEAP